MLFGGSEVPKQSMDCMSIRTGPCSQGRRFDASLSQGIVGLTTELRVGWRLCAGFWTICMA